MPVATTDPVSLAPPQHAAADEDDEAPPLPALPPGPMVLPTSPPATSPPTSASPVSLSLVPTRTNKESDTVVQRMTRAYNRLKTVAVSDVYCVVHEELRSIDAIWLKRCLLDICGQYALENPTPFQQKPLLGEMRDGTTELLGSDVEASYHGDVSTCDF